MASVGASVQQQQQLESNDNVNPSRIQSTATATATSSTASSSTSATRHQRQQQQPPHAKQLHQHHSHAQKLPHASSLANQAGDGGRSGNLEYDETSYAHRRFPPPPPPPSVAQYQRRPQTPPQHHQDLDRHLPATQSPPHSHYRQEHSYHRPSPVTVQQHRIAGSPAVNSIGHAHQFYPVRSYHSHQQGQIGSSSGLLGNVTPTEADVKRIVNEFCQLLEKSKQLFNGLRELPPYGNKHWQVYFGRTFDIYTRLWKFQQQHRQILDSQFGLKRWQIGEIASKIGQLYYHYYLRTSDTGFLLEAFSFYAAIRTRQYYSKATREEKPELVVKKLRYYARFIVVCLLLKKLKLVRDLIRELSRQIEEYINAYDPEDQLEWSLVLTEIKSFVEADNIVNIIDVDSSSVILSHRLTAYNTPPFEKGVPTTLALQEALIVGNTYDQVKFSELTLDMFWMIQALEREPQDDSLNSSRATDASPAPGKTPYDEPSQSTKRNPHKYLLYKPTFSQFFLFVSAAVRELPKNGAILLYISADGAFETVKRTSTPHQAYDFGGLVTNSRRENDTATSSITENKTKTGGQNFRDMHCIYPGDLYPFLRKPLFCIVDSDNSSVFMGMPKLFGQPLIVLTSPVDVPPFLHEQPQRGSLFTLFLHSPLTAFCYVCNIGVVSIAVWDKCQSHVDKFIGESGRLLVRTPSVDSSYIDFYGDDFLRLILLRFIFSHCVLRLHRSFRDNPDFHPHCHPPLPDVELLQHPTLIRLVLDLACILDVMSAFRDSEETVC